MINQKYNHKVEYKAYLILVSSPNQTVYSSMFNKNLHHNKLEAKVGKTNVASEIFHSPKNTRYQKFQGNKMSVNLEKAYVTTYSFKFIIII